MIATQCLRRVMLRRHRRKIPFQCGAHWHIMRAWKLPPPGRRAFHPLLQPRWTHENDGRSGARGRCSAVSLTEARLKSVDEASANDLEWCDGVAVGSPTHMGSIAWQMKRWWDEVAQPLWPTIEGKLGCAFSSSGGLAGGGELTCVALQIVLMNYGLLVFGVPDYVGRDRHCTMARFAPVGRAMAPKAKLAAAWAVAWPNGFTP